MLNGLSNEKCTQTENNLCPAPLTPSTLLNYGAPMTVSDIIDQLGGTGAVARIFGVGAPAVSNWRAAGRFPARQHYRLFRLCRERGITIPEELLTDDEAA